MATLLAKSGVADGLREVRRLVPDVSARRAPLNEAASTLVLVRRYELATAVLADAAKGAPDAAALTARAGVLRKMHRFEDAPVTGPADDPAAAVRRLLSAALDPASTAESLERLIVRVNRRTFEATKFRQGFRGVFVSSSRRDGLPFEFYRDFIQSSVDVAVDGDAVKGWKVKYSFAGAPQTRGTTFFLALEDGEARFVAEGEERADVCRYAYELAKKGDVEGSKRWLDRALDAGGRALDDSRPLAGPLLPRFWPSKSAPDRAALSLAAAAGILGAGKLDDDLYKDARAALLPGERSHGILMLRALQRREEWKELLEKLSPYQDAEKTVEDWDAAAVAALSHLKRYDEAIALGKAHLTKNPDHLLIKRQLAAVLVAKGAFDDARQVSEEIAKSPEANAEDLNTAAWFALIAGKADEASAEQALQGVNASSRKEYGVLHTLAAVYAETSKLDEARSVLMEAIDLEPDQTPGPEDWYVIGRLLESYDLIADAKAAYKKAEREKPSPGSSTFLARQRLEKLGG